MRRSYERDRVLRKMQIKYREIATYCDSLVQGVIGIEGCGGDHQWARNLVRGGLSHLTKNLGRLPSWRSESSLALTSVKTT